MIKNDPMIWIYVIQFAQAKKLSFGTEKEKDNALELYLAQAQINN